MKTHTKAINIIFLCIFLLSAGIGCSEPGIKYSVKIESFTKMASGSYCTYNISSPTNACLPREFFVDVCGKYNVGDVISIEMQKDSQWKSCP